MPQESVKNHVDVAFALLKGKIVERGVRAFESITDSIDHFMRVDAEVAMEVADQLIRFVGNPDIQEYRDFKSELKNLRSMAAAIIRAHPESYDTAAQERAARF